MALIFLFVSVTVFVYPANRVIYRKMEHVIVLHVEVRTVSPKTLVTWIVLRLFVKTNSVIKEK